MLGPELGEPGIDDLDGGSLGIDLGLACRGTEPPNTERNQEYDRGDRTGKIRGCGGWRTILHGLAEVGERCGFAAPHSSMGKNTELIRVVSRDARFREKKPEKLPESRICRLRKWPFIARRMRLVFMGTGEIALPTLRWLIDHAADGGDELVAVYTQPDKPVGRKQVLTPPAVKVLAEAAGIPVFQPERLRGDEAALSGFAELRPDLSVVMAYGQILPKALLRTPSVACVNLHASLLPRHRGAAPSRPRSARATRRPASP